MKLLLKLHKDIQNTLNGKMQLDHFQKLHHNLTSINQIPVHQYRHAQVILLIMASISQL